MSSSDEEVTVEDVVEITALRKQVAILGIRCARLLQDKKELEQRLNDRVDVKFGDNQFITQKLCSLLREKREIMERNGQTAAEAVVAASNLKLLGHDACFIGDDIVVKYGKDTDLITAERNGHIMATSRVSLFSPLFVKQDVTLRSSSCSKNICVYIPGEHSIVLASLLSGAWSSLSLMIPISIMSATPCVLHNTVLVGTENALALCADCAVIASIGLPFSPSFVACSEDGGLIAVSNNQEPYEVSLILIRDDMNPLLSPFAAGQSPGPVSQLYFVGAIPHFLIENDGELVEYYGQVEGDLISFMRVL